MAVPTKDSLFVPYSTNVNDRLVASGVTTYHLTAAQVTEYTSLHTPYVEAVAAFDEARSDGTRSEAQTAVRSAAKAALLNYARQIYGMVQYNDAISDADKILLGVTIRKSQQSSQFAPGQAPLLTLLSVTRRTGRYKLADRAVPSSRRRPRNAIGAVILTYAGATPPPEGDPGWHLEGQTGKNTFLVEFGEKVEPGTPCWVVAMWVSRKGDYSPACDPVQTFLQIGPAVDAG